MICLNFSISLSKTFASLASVSENYNKRDVTIKKNYLFITNFIGTISLLFFIYISTKK
jgi:hypothetical protein